MMPRSRNHKQVKVTQLPCFEVDECSNGHGTIIDPALFASLRELVRLSVSDARLIREGKAGVCRSHGSMFAWSNWLWPVRSA
eukprot:g58995.t1